MPRDGQNSSGESSDFFSPISVSFFGGNQSNTDHQLPPLHDSSWIGARLSPIGSFDREGSSDDDERYTSVYHRALHESLEASAFVNEHTRLLGGDPRSNLHPLWEGQEQQQPRKESKSWIRVSSGLILCSISGVYLFTMLGVDLYQQYYSDHAYSEHGWMLPWLQPSLSTLYTCGAFGPQYMRSWLDYWRVLTAIFMSTSVVEWILLVGAWRFVFLASTKQPWYEWMGVCLASALVGEVWITAFDTSAVLCGSLASGTLGVLCALGMRCPNRRMGLFMYAALLVTMAVVMQPYTSVVGDVGGTFFGWALAVADGRPAKGAADRNGEGEVGRFVGLAAVLTIIMTPIMWMAF